MSRFVRTCVSIVALAVVACMAPDAWAQEANVPKPGSGFALKDLKLFETSTPDRLPSARGQSPTPAKRPVARTPFSGWEIEAHTGGAWTSAPGNSVTPLTPGPQFTTFNGFTSRQVRSWYFGDGASMLNAHMQSGAFSQRVTDLTPVLTTGSTGSSGFSPFGVRAGRTMSPRMGLEIAFDWLSSRTFTSDARSGAAATQNSFKATWDQRLQATAVSRSVTSGLTMTDGGGQVLATAAVSYNLRRSGRVMPYVVAGGGLWFSTGNSPELTLSGDYQFTSASGNVYHQTDTVIARFKSGTSGVVLGGLGVKYELNSRSGVRAEYRFHAGFDPSTVELNWDPRTILSGGAAIALTGNPAIQITNSSSFQKSLSLTQATPDVQVASSDGMRRISQLSVGYFYRFPSSSSPSSPSAQAGRTPAAPAAPAGPRLWDSARKWEADFHVGAMAGSQPTSGTAGNFPAGEPFTAFSGRPSRYESTWMFGDGSLLLNQVLPQFPASIAIDSRIAPLDSTLTSAGVSRSRNVSFGARVARKLTRRLRAEFAVDSTGGSLAISDEALTGIEATRVSFVPVWNGIIASGQGLFTNGNVVATTDLVNDVSNRQTSLTGALEIHLWDKPRFVAYATVGGGVLLRSETAPEATVTGLVEFRVLGVAQFSERDVVRLHYEADSSVPVFMAGFGMKYFLSASRGVRVDLRVQSSSQAIDTVVDATPSSVPGEAFAFSSPTTPTLVLSNTPAIRGNLSGPVITNLKTFTSSGRDIQTSITAGYFFRF
jgi:hypothetical protein